MRHQIQESPSESGCRSLYIRQYSGYTSLFSISDSGCRGLYIRQRMQESLYNRQRLQESLTRQLVQESLHTADAGVSIKQTWGAGVSLSGSGAGVSDNRCRSPYIRKRKQESLYQTVDEEVSISNSGCWSLYIRQLKQKTLYKRQQM